MGSRQECLVLLSALVKSYILIMARTLLILSLVSVVLTQDSLYSSAASESVEPGQYVHNPDWDLTPYQIWKRKQAAKAGTTQISANTIAAAPVEKKVVTVRRQKPVQKQQPQPAVYQQPQQQQPRFDNFQAVQQQPARQQPRRPVQPAFQPAPRREQAYYQPAPVQQQRPAPQQQSFQPRPQPQQQPAYQAQQFAYPRAQHQTYTDQYIYEANNNAQRTYSYTAPTYQAQAQQESYSYQAQY